MAHFTRSAIRLAACALILNLLGAEGISADPPDPDPQRAAVEQLLRSVARELPDARDHAAIQQLITVFSARGVLTDDRSVWMLLTFDRDGGLEAVLVNAEVLLAAAPLIQRAAILHELEHLKRAKETRRLLRASADRHQARRGDLAASASRLQHLVRVLVDDEYRAYRRDILYLYDAVEARGGLASYLATLPPDQRPATWRYYHGHVQPFITADGRLDEPRLRRDFVFLETFPRRHPRYYTAALMWEALQGHVEVRRGRDGRWRPARLLVPTAFLAWLAPS